MIGKTRMIRTQKLWKDTLDNIDKFRVTIAKETNELIPRTELIDRIFRSDKVREMTINDAKRRKGIL